jgi:hypothetical protein
MAKDVILTSANINGAILMTTIKLSTDQEQRETTLLKTCKRWQRGGTLLGDPGFATKYRPEFIDAAAELYRLYSTNEWFSFHSRITRHMAKRFQQLGILSCRGATMTQERVEWLYDKKLQAKAPMKLRS